MQHCFPYPNIPDMDIPDRFHVKKYAPKTIVNPGKAEEAIVLEALQSPIGIPPIASTLNLSSKVLLIIDDISRPTPVHKVLPVLLRQIHASGVLPSQIQILIALGTHRPMTPTEIEAKVGSEIAHKYQIINHEWDNPEALHDYGTLEDGTRVILNRAMYEADYVIGIGSIAPHPAAGFSGGGKIIAPGVATEEAVGTFHWQSVQVPQSEVLGVRENPMRERIDKIASLAGLSAIVNLILDGHNQIVDAFVGHPIEAHRCGCKRALEIFGVEVEAPESYDIFVADTHPLDQDLWQGVKAMCALDCIVPDGAIVILVTPAPEGVSRQHPEITQYGYTTLEKATWLVENRGLSLVAAHNMVQGGRLTTRTSAFMVSPGIPSDQIQAVGFRPFTTPQEALNEALKIKGDNARILILEMGGEICPMVHTNIR